MVEVTQGARDAAWPFMDVIAYDGEARLRAGEYDDNAFIQAIAEAEARGVQQGLDMAAGVAGCERFPADHVEAAWTDGDDGPQHYNQACDDIAAAIRKLGGGDA